MNWIPHENDVGSMIFSLGCEEAAILLQPGEMFRGVLDRNPAWAEKSRFLTPTNPPGGMLSVLPRPALAAFLEAIATHPVEREFQELLFEQAHPSELPNP
jgi:hypothetical protein